MAKYGSRTKYVQDNDLGLTAFKKQLADADRVFVTIGVHQGETNKEGANIAEYAAANEYGTEDIPSRPFMRTTFEENTPWIKRQMEYYYGRVQEGKTTMYDAFRGIGERYQAKIIETIDSRDFLPKLKDATAKAKKGSYKTLIDSGALKGSIRYIVHK